VTEEQRVTAEAARLATEEKRLAKELAKELAKDQVRLILPLLGAKSYTQQEKVMKTIKTGDFVCKLCGPSLMPCSSW